MKTLHLALFAYALLASPGNAFAQSQAPSLVKQQEQCVAFLFGTVHPLDESGIPMKDSAGKPIALYQPLGTAFIVFYPDSRGGLDYGFVYLVTAKHVLRDANGKFFRKVDLRMNAKSQGVEFIKDIPVSNESEQLLWYHSEKDADEAVALDFLPSRDKFDFKVIPVDMFVDDALLKSADVQEGDSLYFIGLLAQFYGEKRNYPVVRRGTLAMTTDEDIPTKAGSAHLFIAELQSWPGNSGSPVFLSLGGMRHGGVVTGENFRFFGILLGVFNSVIPVDVLETSKALVGSKNPLPVGVSLIVPAMSLRQLLDSKEAQSSRDRMVKNKQ